MKLLIGNKNYSSWSMRPWLVLSHFAIPFEEQLAPLTGEGWKQNLEKLSPTGCVPVLFDGDLVLPETLAIIEYLADTHPHKPIWPTSTNARAKARVFAAEMHAGFPGLRTHAPMNLKKSFPGRIEQSNIQADVSRFDKIVEHSMGEYNGPYLFGEFSAADAMFAPLASRLRTYEIPCGSATKSYIEAIYDLPAFQEWLSGAVKDPSVVAQDEIDVIQGVST